MSTLSDIIIVGGSLAGLRSAEALRRRGYEGRLVMVGAEAERPYDRPPLSKELLRGDREPEKISLSKPEAFDALELELHLGVAAEALQPGPRSLRLSNGEQLDYEPGTYDMIHKDWRWE